MGGSGQKHKKSGQFSNSFGRQRKSSGKKRPDHSPEESFSRSGSVGKPSKNSGSKQKSGGKAASGPDSVASFGQRNNRFSNISGGKSRASNDKEESPYNEDDFRDPMDDETEESIEEIVDHIEDDEELNEHKIPRVKFE